MAEIERRTVGQNVRRIRAEKKISQVDLADRMKSRQPAIWKIERSKGLPHGRTLLKLAKALEVSIEELVVDVDDDYKALRMTGSVTPPSTNRTSQQGGAADDPASARVLEELRRENAALKATLGQVRKTAEALGSLAISGPGPGQAASHKPRGRKRRRKTG